MKRSDWGLYGAGLAAVTITHPLSPLKRGGLGVKAQFMEIPTVIS
jgi:hypothetical protein